MHHPLAVKLYQSSEHFDQDTINKIITDYLRERAEWLKGFLASEKNDYVDKAFELEQEKEECEHAYPDPNKCIYCLGEKETKSELLKKLRGNWVTDSECLNRVTAKIDEIIDYLAKERKRWVAE